MNKNIIQKKMMNSIHLKETIDGVAEKSINSNLRDYQIFGNTVQDDEPTVDNPVEVVSVGELVTEGENAGKYKIPIEISNGKETVIEYIYLTEPLRKIGEHQDYIDFRNQKVYRNVRELVLTGEENFAAVFATGVNKFYRFKMTNEQLAPSNFSDWTTQKCNYYIGANSTTTNTDVGISVYYSSSNSCTYCRVRDNDNFPTVTDFLAFLKEKYAEGNPLVVCYQSYDTIEEDIELQKLPQFKGTTIYQIPTAVQGEFVGTYKTRL